MGAWVCKRPEPARVLFMGLDAAGKTTLLYRLKLGEVVTTIPTIGFNVETVDIEGFQITCWDVGGRDKIRPLLRHYLQNTTGLVYVVDSNDRERITDAFDELVRYFLKEEECGDIVCMVLANKQDLAGAMGVPEVEDALKKTLAEKRHWSQTIFVAPVSATTGEGVDEAFRCFLEQVELKKSKSKSSSPSGLISVDYTTGQGDKTSPGLTAASKKNSELFIK